VPEALVACIIKKNNSPFYYVKYYVEGKSAELSTKSRNIEVAKRIRRKIEDELILGKFGLISTSSNVSVKDAYNEFVETYKRKVNEISLDRYIRSLRPFLDFHSDIHHMHKFKYQHINEYLNKRAQLIKQSSQYNELRAIKLFFGLCEKLHNIPSPARNIAIKKPPRKEPNIYSQEEIIKLLSVRDPRAKAAIMLDLQAGLRKGEMASRKWKHIDFDRNTVRILVEKDFMPKDKDSRTIPLRKETREALVAWRKKSKYTKEEDYIFTGSRGKAITHFDRFML
jgi:integrase